MSFRITGKQFTLTYPKCDADFEEIYDLLSSKGRIQHAIISKELHADGSNHRHVYVYYAKKLNFKSHSCFDIGQYHGNYETTKNPAAWIQYIKKDNNFKEYKEEMDNESLLDKCKSMTETEFFNHCVKEKIQIGYYNEAKRLCSDYFTIIDNDAKGNL